jgi:tetratricopeptide (TPR) repeat protein
MSSPEEPKSIEVQTQVRELLGRGTLARARGRREEAIKLVQQAIVLDETNPEAHELMGDLLLDLKRGEEAMERFRRARELRPGRTTLEDKIARAALQKAARFRSLEYMQAVLEGREKPEAKRNPGLAALLSLVIPGFGQLYNGDVVKGLAVASAYIFLLAIAILAVLAKLASAPPAAGGTIYGRQMDMGTITSALFSGSTLVATIALFCLWIYSVADAALRAGKTMTSEGTGLV